MARSLRLVEHDLAGAALALPAVPRVLFMAAGEARVVTGDGERRIGPGTAWHGAGACTVHGAGRGRLLRFELVGQPPPEAGGGQVRLEHPVPIELGARYLMRCDRVEFAPGGVALPHRHRGGGIRRLLTGALTVTVGEAPPRLMRPGDPWFESGREPVLAVADPALDTSFVRVSILPVEIRGKSSIMYVDPADAERGRPRTYTVYVDEPLDLGSR